MKQKDYQRKIKSIVNNKKKLDDIVQDARSRIESYKPYEVCHTVMSRYNISTTLYCENYF